MSDRKFKNDFLKIPRGKALLCDPVLNKGTVFNEAEREALGLQGLLPPRVFSPEDRALHIISNLRRKTTDLEKYLYLAGLQNRNENLFYRVLIDNMQELMPIIYTPTVGQACQEFSRIFSEPRGIFITKNDRGRIKKILKNWPRKNIRVIVVTDGERILGLGDLGANGMGIPIGKLSLYTACAGIDPKCCLPVTIDVGTNNQELLNAPDYIGLPEQRLRGREYDLLINEFMAAATKRFPGVMIQFEDFGNANAFRLLEAFRDKYCMFNDDIQGTASVTLAGLYSALRITGGRLSEQRLLFLGAGEAAIGIGNLVSSAMTEEGLSLSEARRNCWFVDSKGLVVGSRTDLVEHKRPYAHDYPFQKDLLSAVMAVKPTAIIGVSGQPKTFTPEILTAMGGINDRPIVFALSNPTSKAECTAEEAYRYTDKRAIFASGSPFPDVNIDGRTFVPGQSNNAYIFPGVGLGVLASAASRVTDEMFTAAAKSLVEQVTGDDLKIGRIFPSLSRIREVSANIALAVAKVVFSQGLTEMPESADLPGLIKSTMYEPDFDQYV
ncbi:MAG: NAD-dependent malic enzyme [Deltaproteobacteria bacterium HGW-Deltaproteobacteria-13]|nr:MAG: NAD-dependent malic enzyme [Deltaproteobacteria bacterium HGW-Deltaproteobacteria-13]